MNDGMPLKLTHARGQMMEMYKGQVAVSYRPWFVEAAHFAKVMPQGTFHRLQSRAGLVLGQFT